MRTTPAIWAILTSCFSTSFISISARSFSQNLTSSWSKSSPTTNLTPATKWISSSSYSALNFKSISPPSKGPKSSKAKTLLMFTGFCSFQRSLVKYTRPTKSQNQAPEELDLILTLANVLMTTIKKFPAASGRRERSRSSTTKRTSNNCVNLRRKIGDLKRKELPATAKRKNKKGQDRKHAKICTVLS